MQVAVIHTAFEDTPRTVAMVEVGERTGTEALEYAYRWTNNVEGSWSLGVREFEDGESNGDYNSAVTVVGPMHVDENGKTWGLRSTSVGDHMLMGTEKYVVASFGFDKLSDYGHN